MSSHLISRTGDERGIPPQVIAEVIFTMSIRLKPQIQLLSKVSLFKTQNDEVNIIANVR